MKPLPVPPPTRQRTRACFSFPDARGGTEPSRTHAALHGIRQGNRLGGRSAARFRRRLSPLCGEGSGKQRGSPRFLLGARAARRHLLLAASWLPPAPPVPRAPACAPVATVLGAAFHPPRQVAFVSSCRSILPAWLQCTLDSGAIFTVLGERHHLFYRRGEYATERRVDDGCHD